MARVAGRSCRQGLTRVDASAARSLFGGRVNCLLTRTKQTVVPAGDTARCVARTLFGCSLEYAPLIDGLQCTAVPRCRWEGGVRSLCTRFDHLMVDLPSVMRSDAPPAAVRQVGRSPGIFSTVDSSVAPLSATYRL